MSPQAHREEEQAGIEAMESPGRRLRIARQAKGMTQADVAGQMHLNTSTIEALEADNHDSLPGPVFVRGYLRNYARLLGMDENEVIAEFNGNTQGHTPNATPSLARNSQKEIRSSHIGVRLMTWVIILGLIALLVAWWQGRIDWPEISGSTTTGDAEEPASFESDLDDGSLRLPQLEQNGFETPQELSTRPTGAPGADTSAELAPPQEIPADPPQESPPQSLTITEAPSEEPVSTPSPELNEPAPTVAEPTVAITQGPAESIASAPATVAPTAADPTGFGDAASEPTTEAAPADGQKQVVFEFLGACWVDVRDSTRKFKLFGEMRKGEKRLLGGTPPYSVILGNSPMVRVTVDGEPYDVEAHSRGNVARFSLDPAQMN